MYMQTWPQINSVIIAIMKRNKTAFCSIKHNFLSWGFDIHKISRFVTQNELIARLCLRVVVCDMSIVNIKKKFLFGKLKTISIIFMHAVKQIIWFVKPKAIYVSYYVMWDTNFVIYLTVSKLQ